MSPHLTAVHPHCAIEGGRISLEGHEFPIDGPRLPEVRIGDSPARVVQASPTRISVLVPTGLDGGPTPVTIAGVPGEPAFVDVAAPFATGLHQVDNPAFDRDGNLYVTYSGTRGQQVPVSIFRVRPNGTREAFSSGIVNPTSMAVGPDGRLYVSSRFEGTVYRVQADGSTEPFAHDLGVACGLAFAPDGTLLVGDRSGTIFRVDSAGHATAFATLPSSVAAFHLAMAPGGSLFVCGPTLSTYDTVYEISPEGTVSERYRGFGRPQGVAVDPSGDVFVVDALAGSSGLYRLPAAVLLEVGVEAGAEGVPGAPPELVLSGPGLIGAAFSTLEAPRGDLVVCSNDTAYRLRAASVSVS